MTAPVAASATFPPNPKYAGAPLLPGVTNSVTTERPAGTNGAHVRNGKARFRRRLLGKVEQTRLASDDQAHAETSCCRIWMAQTHCKGTSLAACFYSRWRETVADECYQVLKRTEKVEHTPTILLQQDGILMKASSSFSNVQQGTRWASYV